MIKFFVILFIFFVQLQTAAQQLPATKPIETTPIDQSIESIAEVSLEADVEDDSYLQNLAIYLKHPINLNTATENELKELMVLTPIQINNLIQYRILFKNLINIYELQAVPGWDLQTIQKIRNYVTVYEKANLIETFRTRMKQGQHTILIRATQVLEKSKGYTLNSTTANNFYPGSPQKYFLRYQYRFKNLLQYGFVAEKDAGEQFFKGAQKQGFDFYSAHLFARKIGIIKSLALGDFTVNLGQGLIQWQSLAFTLTSDISLIKRQSDVLRPYNSAGEYNFHRGVGLTIIKKNIETTLFASYKKIDANFQLDTTVRGEDFVTSFQTSGYHRTKSETDDKGVQTQLAFGGNVAYNKNNFHIGMNAIQYHFSLPLQKTNDPYNLYALAGKKLGNYSVDYSYTFKNIHLFGEAAINNNMYKAFVNGLLASVSANADISILYRNISKGYQSLYSNAFTENTFPTNEKGVFLGLCLRPNMYWQVSAYADIYKQPWLKYLGDAPTNGVAYLLQTTYKPNKQFEINCRYRMRLSQGNDNPLFITLPPVVNKPLKNFRTQFNYKINAAITLRSRVELSWYDKNNKDAATGFLSFFDIVCKPMMKKYSGNLRLQYFETEDYNSRLYAFENDVMYSYSIPVFYDKGYRFYLNFNYDINKRISVWIRLAQTIYKDKNIIGSGLDEINGNKKSEIKLQMQYLF